MLAQGRYDVQESGAKKEAFYWRRNLLESLFVSKLRQLARMMDETTLGLSEDTNSEREAPAIITAITTAIITAIITAMITAMITTR